MKARVCGPPIPPWNEMSHGTLSARDAWEITALSARGRYARLQARFYCDRPDLLAAFPFRHRPDTVIDVDSRSLSVATSVTPTERRSVPVSLGYHPYLRLPRGRRSEWRLSLPKRLQLELDDRGIPTGRRSLAPAESEPIGNRAFDDLFELVRGRTLSIEGDGRRLSVDYGPGLSVRAGLHAAGQERRLFGANHGADERARHR